MKDVDLDILVKGCIDWDRKSQSMLYNYYCRKMFAVCLRYSKNNEEAEDTLQESFVKVFENLKNFKGEGSLEGWIRRITINTAIEKFRKNSNKITYESLDEKELNLSYPENSSEEIGEKELISLIHGLPPKSRMVFNLYAIEGFNHREISEKLGISEGTSKSNLHDARMALQKALNKIKSTEDIRK